MRLEGKSALVTGGASGFGAEIVRQFAGEGANVVILDLDGPGASVSRVNATRAPRLFEETLRSERTSRLQSVRPRRRMVGWMLW